MSKTIDTHDTVAQVAQLERGNTNPFQNARVRNRSRGWCFTINNPDLSDKREYIDTLTQKFIVAKYYIFGIERGASGTEHIQGYVYYRNPVSFNTIKDLIPRAHIEKARGNPSQNYDYCAKEGDFYTNMQGGRTWEQVVNEILEEATRNVDEGEHEDWMDRII